MAALQLNIILLHKQLNHNNPCREFNMKPEDCNYPMPSYLEIIQIPTRSFVCKTYCCAAESMYCANLLDARCKQVRFE